MSTISSPGQVFLDLFIVVHDPSHMSSRFAETRIRGYGSDVSFATDTGELASPHIYHFITWASFSDFFIRSILMIIMNSMNAKSISNYERLQIEKKELSSYYAKKCISLCRIFFYKTFLETILEYYLILTAHIFCTDTRKCYWYCRIWILSAWICTQKSYTRWIMDRHHALWMYPLSSLLDSHNAGTRMARYRHTHTIYRPDRKDGFLGWLYTI